MATGHAKTSWCRRPEAHEKEEESTDERDKWPGEAYLDTKDCALWEWRLGGQQEWDTTAVERKKAFGGIRGPVIPRKRSIDQKKD